MRLINVYDIDNRTYLFKLSRQEEKAVMLVESGNRIHRTEYEWPKNPAPSSFTMKLRKHIHNRRLEQIKQLGVDRIIDLQFGCNEAAYHVILELYDKGNIVLTDYEYTILNILRPRTESEKIRFAVHEKYPVHLAKQNEPIYPKERWQEIFLENKAGESLKKILNRYSEYGPALIDHVLLKAGFPDGCKLRKDFNFEEDWPRLEAALEAADQFFNEQLSKGVKGYILQKPEEKPVLLNGGEMDTYLAFLEFHPFLFHQHKKKPYVEFPTFNKAVDEYFSQLESQKLDMKVIHKEKEALKKLDNVKKDHEHRIDSLQKAQEEDKVKAELIEMNLDLVSSAITTVQSALANQLQWKEIANLITQAAQQGDHVASAIKEIKLEINNITLLLGDPFQNENGTRRSIDIDLDLTAYANAKRYYDKKRKAVVKEQKTVESSTKAMKSAERKTKQTLKEAATISSINKARKTHWFEKFLWFISSENYLAIGGHDQQQNELIVKRYMRSGDIYVHADLHGASSIVVKNPLGSPVPPKTLNEAGTMAVCSSVAWDSKVVTSAWWVHHDQVSKTAPTGEYLKSGSFMIRGKKNYLPPCYLIMGFGFLFRLDDESIINHKDERKVKNVNDGDEDDLAVSSNDVEVEVPDESDEEQDNEDSLEKEEFPDKENPLHGNENADQTEFPDTKVQLEHVDGDKFFMKTCASSQFAESVLGDDNEPSVGVQHHEVVTKNKKNICPKENVTSDMHDADKASSTSSTGSCQMKRGQKYKLKKIKEKYKDQDDEDRELAMAILQPAGEKKKKKESKESKSKAGKNKQQTKKLFQKQSVPAQTSSYEIPLDADIAGTDAKEAVKQIKEVAADLDAEDEKEDTQQAAEDSKLFDALTGKPLGDDVLLYAIPVCGPYNAILNYKFKMKLTPGSSKRGKAAKTALNVFLHDRTITSREKDLLRSVKDQDISRNLPGKVKLVAASGLLKQKHR